MIERLWNLMHIFRLPSPPSSSCLHHHTQREVEECKSQIQHRQHEVARRTHVLEWLTGVGESADIARDPGPPCETCPGNDDKENH